MTTYENIKPVTDRVQRSVLAEWWPTFQQKHDEMLSAQAGKPPVFDAQPAPVRQAKLSLEIDGPYLRSLGVSDAALASVFGTTAVRVRAVLGDGFE